MLKLKLKHFVQYYGFFYTHMIKNSINLIVQWLKSVNISMRYNLKILLSVILLVHLFSALFVDAKPERHSTVSAVSDSKNPCKNNSGSRFDSMMQSPFTSRTLSLREQIEIAAYIQVQDAIYREKFNMGFYEFDHAMRLGYDDFIHKSFEDLKLSDEAIKELWQTNKLAFRFTQRRKF